MHATDVAVSRLRAFIKQQIRWESRGSPTSPAAAHTYQTDDMCFDK